MRTSLFIALLLTIIVVVGCSQPHDFGAFVVAEVSKYGGHTKTTATIPKLDARWTVKSDSNGFTLLVTDAPLASIAAEMEQAFGPPIMTDDGSSTASHEPYRLWAAIDIGVGIQVIGHKDSTEIICLRGIP